MARTPVAQSRSTTNTTTTAASIRGQPNIMSFFKRNLLPTPMDSENESDTTPAATHTTSKRKYDNNHYNDDFEEEEPIQERIVKRTRVLSHVEIVVQKPQHDTPPKTHVPFVGNGVVSTNPPQQQPQKGVVVSLPSPKNTASLLSRSESPDVLTTDTQTIARPQRRRISRPSYASFFNSPGSNSEEDGNTRARTRNNPRRRNLIQDSDDDDDFASIHTEQESSAEEPFASSSVVQSEEDSELEDISEEEVKKPRARNPLKATREMSNASEKIPNNRPAGKQNYSKQRMHSLVDRKLSKRGVIDELPPLSSTTEIFSHLTSRALEEGLGKVVEGLGSRPLRVATMCSGTESPLLALQMIRDCLSVRGDLPNLDIEHVFSAEIVPFKQAYIERNFQPPTIFRDIVEITKSQDGMATTAYGARVEIPGDVDIVVAGTACVDFSLLNINRKGLRDSGESGDTFEAVLTYAKRYRPRLLVLENTYGAPWDEMLSDYEAIGYAAAGVIVDTKEFYLPQTRTRGYMFCVDQQLNIPNTNTKSIVKNWPELMAKLKRPVSSPVSAFLLPNDDREVVLSRDRIARQSVLDTAMRDVDWSKCEERHRNYRLNSKLGYGKPYTSWEPSGTLVLYDYVDRAWHKGQVERVWDFEECSLLRKAREYDSQFKTRVWDVSQNIDRFTDTAPFGVASCLTPSGNFFVTDRGGPLTFAESLGLQGLPREKLIFTSETERQVQDLAGNAMSTTVVGAALVAALISAKAILQDAVATRDIREAEVTPMSGVVFDQGDLVQKATSAENSEIDVVEMTKHALASARKCYCEGQISMAEKPIQTCVDCQHTTCLDCGGKPAHNYRVTDQDRETPNSFIQTWRPKFPMRLRLHKLESIEDLLTREMSNCDTGKNKKGQAFNSRYLEAVRKAISKEFKFSHFRRSLCWKITYEAPNAQLVLTISTQGTRWTLFAIPDAELAGNDPLRLFLNNPIARTDVKSHILGSSWQWCVPGDINFDLKIAAGGVEIPAWTARLNLPGEEGATLWQTLHIDYAKNHKPDLEVDVSGTYEHLRRCGTAREALYKKIDGSGSGSSPLFLFLDQARLGEGKDDKFVFSANPERLQYDEVRDVVASIDCRWRPWNDDVSSAAVMTNSRWVNEKKISLRSENAKLEIYGHLNPEQLVLHDDCARPFSLVQCKFEVGDLTSNLYQGLHHIQADDKAFFHTFAWALEPVRPHVNFDQEYAISLGQSDSCRVCAPQLPKIEWANSTRNGGQEVMRPYEDPKGATTYEILLKNRPEIFTVQSNIENGYGTITIGYNSFALAHRASARLEKMFPDFHPVISTTWTLDTQFSSLPLSLPAFYLSSNDTSKSFHIPLPNKVQLWEKQMQSLAWMRSQEAGEGKEIILEAGEEALLPHLGWRAEARSRASLHVRGGILADHPGFGKTITSLSLIHSEFHDHQNSKNQHEAIINGMRDLPLPLEQPGPIKIAATLVLVTKAIAQQWYSEVGSVLGKEYQSRTILIESGTDLRKYTIDSFKKARIIILNRDVLSRKTYTSLLAEFSGLPAFGEASRKRDFKAWLDLVLPEVYDHANVLQDKGAPALVKHIEAKLKKRVENKTVRSFAIASKRLRGKQYAKKASSTNTNDEEEEARKEFVKPEAKNLRGIVLFEMFHFNRIIVDEFSYILENKDGSMTSAMALKADKRWALSATPPLKDAYDVAQIARVIGVNLSTGFNMPGLLSTKNMSAIKDGMTNVELFEMFREAPSHALLNRVHELAQNFLNDFVRQNLLLFTDFEYSDHIVPLTLHLDHGIVYNELSQQLNSQDMRIVRPNKSSVKGQDREEQIQRAVSGMQRAEQALSESATFFSAVSDGGKTGVFALLQKRKDERNSNKIKLNKAIEESQHLNATLKCSEYPFEVWQKAVLPGNQLLDQGVTDEIKSMIAVAQRTNPTPAKRDTLQKAQAKGRDPSLDKMMSKRADVNHFAFKLAASTRSLRFVENSQRLQSLVAKGGSLEKCDSARCVGHIDSNNLSVSSVCGHVICDSCFLDSQKDVGICGASGCMHSIQKFHLLRASRMGPAAAVTTPEQSLTLKSDQGKKVAIVTEILQRIQAHGQQAVLFVREHDHVAKMQQVLLEGGVSCVAVNTDAAKRITEFQNTKASNNGSTAAKKTVIILNADDESAAGSNLTNANHVIFLSPLLKMDQYGYESQMAQAIGRVRRPGQTKDIFIYRMVALHTIDVDVLEHRERLDRVLVEKKVCDVWASRLQSNDVEMSDDDDGNKPFSASETADSVQRTQLIKDSADGLFKLVPKNLLLRRKESKGTVDIDGAARVKGFEEFNALIKFSKAYADG